MKKKKVLSKGFMALVLTLILLLGLAACGGGSSVAKPEGTFYCTQTDYGDGLVPVEGEEEFITFEADGTGIWMLGIESPIKWKLKADKLSITQTVFDDKFTYEADWDGEKILLDYAGYNSLYEKKGSDSSADIEKPATVAEVDSAVLGRYEGTGYDVQGTRFDPAGEWLELNGDGTGSMTLGPVDTPFDWTLEGDTINIKTIQGLSYKAILEGKEITLDTGMLYFFKKDDGTVAAAKTPAVKSTSSGIQPAGSLQVPSKWYGVAIITDSEGFELADGQYDVWGLIDKDTTGPAYFELFLVPEPRDLDDPTGQDYAVLSMYIDEEEKNWLTPIIGDEDAWILDMYLDEDDEWSLLTMYDKGALDINYTCDDGGSRFAYCRFFVREYGTMWDEAVDPLPDSYPEYAAEFYSESSDTSGTIKGLDNIAINPADLKFSWGSDDYGKNGWVFTTSGSMKMQIPQGWEVQTALHDTSIGVRSNSVDGDVIMADIEEYSSMIKDPAQRTPENQAKQNYESATIIKDKWGNTDVWYRIYEWSDYTTISGFAAYDAENYVGFDIRVKKVNGTVEQFMKSAAWDTLRKTFELTRP